MIGPGCRFAGRRYARVGLQPPPVTEPDSDGVTQLEHINSTAAASTFSLTGPLMRQAAGATWALLPAKACNSLSCWRTRPARASWCGSESANDVKAARRFAELQRRASIRALQARKRAIK